MRVNTDELNRQSAELGRLAARINDIEDTVLWVTRELSRERFGEQFRPPLYNMAASIAGRAEELSRMGAALQQISVLYERAECRILDETEHANVHYDRERPTLIPIPGFWQRFLWQTRPTNPYHIHLPTDPAEDVQVVDGLPTLGDLGWDEVIGRAFDSRHGRGYIPPVEIPVYEPISIPRDPAAPSSLIDWTPWDA